MFKTVNHTGLTVESVDESLKFFRDTIGLSVDESRSGEWNGEFLTHLTGYEGTHLRIAMVECADGMRIQLEEFVNPRLPRSDQEWGQPGSGHICVEVEDIFAVCDALKKGGYTIVSNPPEPVPLPPESVFAGGFFLGALDPDGHVIEMVQPPEHLQSWK